MGSAPEDADEDPIALAREAVPNVTAPHRCSLSQQNSTHPSQPVLPLWWHAATQRITCTLPSLRCTVQMLESQGILDGLPPDNSQDSAVAAPNAAASQSTEQLVQYAMKKAKRSASHEVSDTVKRCLSHKPLNFGDGRSLHSSRKQPSGGSWRTTTSASLRPRSNCRTSEARSRCANSLAMTRGRGGPSHADDHGTMGGSLSHTQM